MQPTLKSAGLRRAGPKAPRLPTSQRGCIITRSCVSTSEASSAREQHALAVASFLATTIVTVASAAPAIADEALASPVAQPAVEAASSSSVTVDGPQSLEAPAIEVVSDGLTEEALPEPAVEAAAMIEPEPELASAAASATATAVATLSPAAEIVAPEPVAVEEPLNAALAEVEVEESVVQPEALEAPDTTAVVEPAAAAAPAAAEDLIEAVTAAVEAPVAVAAVEEPPLAEAQVDAVEVAATAAEEEATAVAAEAVEVVPVAAASVVVEVVAADNAEAASGVVEAVAEEAAAAATAVVTASTEEVVAPAPAPVVTAEAEAVQGMAEGAAVVPAAAEPVEAMAVTEVPPVAATPAAAAAAESVSEPASAAPAPAGGSFDLRSLLAGITAAASPSTPGEGMSAETVTYGALGAAAISFLGTFFVAPRFKEAFKEPVDWRDMYASLAARGIKTVTAEEAYAKAKKGAVILDVRLADSYSRRAAASSVNVPLYQPIAGWDLASNIRRTGFAFFGIFGTELNEDFVAEVASKVPKNKEVIVMCETGGSLENKPGTQFGFQSRSLKALYYLQQAGYGKVLHMKGGLGDWQRAGLPLSEDSKDQFSAQQKKAANSNTRRGANTSSGSSTGRGTSSGGRVTTVTNRNGNGTKASTSSSTAAKELVSATTRGRK